MRDGHKAPWRSVELTAYFDHLMDEFAKSRDGKRLVFTPPTTRGSLITIAEAWIINTQREYVPTLTDAGRWPIVEALAHPDTISSDQARWLSLPGVWGDAARLWAERGWMPAKPALDLVPPSKPDPVTINRPYREMVLDLLDKAERSDRQARRDRKHTVERCARSRL